MPSSMTQIRTALATTLSEAGLTVYPTIQDAINAPAAVVAPDPKTCIEYGKAMRMGSDTYYFCIQVLVAPTEISNAQNQLDSFITGQGEHSLRQLLFGNNSIGLPDVNVYVSACTGYGGTPQIAGFPYIGALMHLTVTVD